MIGAESVELALATIRPGSRPGQVRAADRPRHRDGDGRGDPPPRVRAVLHHQGARPGHRPRPLDLLRDRPADGRRHLVDQRARRRDGVRDPAAARSTAPRPRRRLPRRSPRAAARPCCSSRTTPTFAAGWRARSAGSATPCCGPGMATRRSPSCARTATTSIWCSAMSCSPGRAAPRSPSRSWSLSQDSLVLWMSGYSDHHALRGLLDGDGSCLPKPFTADLLARTVREALDRTVR